MTEINEPNAIKLATVEPLPLVGQPPSDKAFAVVGSGTIYRVRLKLAEEIAPAFAATGGLAPNLQALDITLTRLDAEGAVVERDGFGRVIMPAHTRLTIDETTRARPGFSMATEIDREVRRLIWEAEQRREADAATADYLATEWAIEPPAPPPPPAAPVPAFIRRDRPADEIADESAAGGAEGGEA